jgi:O-antigen/teichoic acid export membrane protein
VTKLRHNVIANFGGQAWGLLMSLAFVPVYIRILGIEAYGLIGFFLSLQAFFLILDMGLAATINRELARCTHAGADADGKRDLVRTLEWVYWPTGLLIAVGVLALSGPIASHWLKPVSLSVNQAAHAITLMGLAAAMQWPFGLYAGGLRGLERQVALNGFNAFFATLRSVGAVGVILYYSPTLAAFLWWQVAVGALQTLASGGLLWRLLPTGTRVAAFRLERLIEQRAFALGMTGIVAVSFLLTQSDRIILSTLLPLTQFGYYTLASTVAFAMSAVVGPFFNALYPRFSGLVAAGDEKKLIELYHQSNQLVAVVVASVASVLSFFSYDVLLLWTHNLKIAQQSSPILSILVVGTALNGLMNLPYALQLAYGWTRLALYQNLVAVLIVVPSMWWLGHRFGGIGAATVWVALNLGYALMGIPLMHQKLLRQEMSAWYWHDVLPPTLTAVAVAGTLWLLVPVIPNGLQGITTISAIGAVTLGISLLATPTTRLFAHDILKKFTGYISDQWPR